MLVLVFVLLMLSLFGVAYRQTASALRIAEVQMLQRYRDEGSMPAVARGLQLLESGLPPTDPFVCGIQVNTSVGSRSYALVFSSTAKNEWRVASVPVNSIALLPPIPSSFVPLKK